ELRAWVLDTFGGEWGGRRGEVTARASEPLVSAPRFHLREDPVKEAYLSLGFPIPAVDHDDAPALDLLAMIAGQGEASRLVLEVKRKKSLVNEIHAYAYTPRDPGIFVASLTAQPQHLEAALEETARVLSALRTTLVPADELATVKALVECEAVYQRETVQGLARKLGYYESAVGGIEREARYYERIAQVSAGELREVARRYVDFSRAVVTGLLPAGSPLDEAKARAALSKVSAETPAAPAPRAPAAAPSPMRITAPLAARRGDSRIHVEKLPGGAQVVVREESAVPLFAIRAVFPGGLRYETDEDNGLTTLLCRMLTRGTPDRDAESISRLIDELAGSLSGSGGRNSVSLRGEFLSRHFERAFALFSDCLSNPSFPEAELERERSLMLQDIATREDKPSGLCFELFARTLYQRHPYRLSMLGETAPVEKLKAEQLRAYHDQHMDPSQLTLCVVGDVSTDRVLALAHEAFGRARGKAAPPPEVPAEQAVEAPREARRTLARAQTHLVLGFHAAKVNDPWRRSLEVLSTVLSGQGGRLFIELRDKRSMAYSVSAFAMEGVDPGYFAVYMGTSPEKVDAALLGIRAELARLRDEPLPEDELERAKQNLIGTHEIGLQRNGARAAVMALDHCYGLGADRFLSYADEVAKVTAADVREVARRIIDPARAVLAVVGP
ncbi:MAG: M16 family metallopeptidase, partial [Myxococcaceae bacterium]